MNQSWKSFWVGAIASVVIALVAGISLNSINETSQEKFSTSNTRINN